MIRALREALSFGSDEVLLRLPPRSGVRCRFASVSAARGNARPSCGTRSEAAAAPVGGRRVPTAPTGNESHGFRMWSECEQSAPLLDATRASASAIGLSCRYVGYGRGSSLRVVRFVRRRLAVLAQVRRPGGGQRDARAASRHMVARDEPAVVGCFPHREARTRGSPRLEHLCVRTRAWADPLEKVNDQGVDGVRHERRRSGEHSREAGAHRLGRQRRTAPAGLRAGGPGAPRGSRCERSYRCPQDTSAGPPASTESR